MLLILVSIIASLTGLLTLSRMTGRQTCGQTLFTESPGLAEYLFDGEDLVDATPAARALLLDGTDHAASAWSRLMTVLSGHFPAISQDFASLRDRGGFSRLAERADTAPLHVQVELRGGLTRIRLADPETDDAAVGFSPLAHRALHDEVAHLRAAVAHAPLPMWRQTEGGDVTWANSAYLRLAVDRLPPDEDLTWPLPRLFDKSVCNQGTAVQRQKLDGPVTQDRRGQPATQAPNWFDLSGCDVAEGRLIFAQPSDAVVRAEASLRSFMQTLTKTFAQLSTGLAIFDQTRQLALFNPALIDLTTLPPDMLSARPSLLTFFDALRERSMIPEPRDYRSWRRQITDIEDAAKHGNYQEVWNLSGGQTWRVTGRPHPNGALALMFEDISSEMSQTRRYQADLELGQAVIDAMDEAIAVFGPSGSMVMSNAAYSDLWGHDPAGSLASDGGIVAICGHWRERAAPSGLWDRTEDFVATLAQREAWSDATFLRDGRHLTCRAAPLAGGATLLGFRVGDIAEVADFGAKRLTA